MKNSFHVFVCKNYEHVCDELAQKVLSLSKRVIARAGVFNLMLAGGTTPKGLYLRMSGPDFRDQFDWHKIHLFWGDERWVPTDDIRSNYRMVAESLLTRIDIPPENIHPMITTKKEEPEATALHYEEEFIKHFQLSPGEFPRFDLILLGMGQDGHVASLFPKSAEAEERKRLVVTALHEDIEEPRITVTVPVINQAAHVFFMVCGIEKSQVVQLALEPAEGSPVMPAHLVHPSSGELSWYIDNSTASMLKKVHAQ